MKIMIEISDDEVRDEVFNLLTRRIADQIFSDRHNLDEYAFRQALKQGVNAVLKERADEIVDRCIPQASAYIGKKGVKKFAELLEGEAGQ